MYTSAGCGAVPIPGFALSELAEIRQQFAGIREECTGHLLWQHCMLSIAAAFANPHAGPSWTNSTASSRIVSTLCTSEIVAFIRLSSNHKNFDLLKSSLFPCGLSC